MPSYLSGFIIRITRERIEGLDVGNKVHYRTVGAYQCYTNDFPLSSGTLSGTTVESLGPGDNSSIGEQQGRRLEVGTYRLGIQSGHQHRTSPDGAIDEVPCLLVHDAGDLPFVSIRPGNGFGPNKGSINLTDTLTGPEDTISYSISQDRLVSLITTMKVTLGTRFPVNGTGQIKDAWLVIEGEPV